MSVALSILAASESPDGRRPPVAPATTHETGHLHDSHGRVIRDLRLSVTDRCNYRCVYCMDPDFRYLPKKSLLHLAEYVTIARVAAGLGIEKLRITGGEPLLYPGLSALIDAVGAMGFRDVALTTNGSRHAGLPLERWRRAGLRRVTFSLDSLRPDRVAAITRTKTTSQTVVNAIEAAREAGFDPIKVNAVIMRGVNDDEVADLADFARAHAVDVRLIEFMPLDSSRAWRRRDVVGADEMLETIRCRHDLVARGERDASSTSCNFEFADGAPGSIGVIAPVTRPFCGACARLRITADGKVRPCLFSHDEWDLRAVLRDGADDAAISRFLKDATWTKQPGHGIGGSDFAQPTRTMSSIGG